MFEEKDESSTSILIAFETWPDAYSAAVRTSITWVISELLGLVSVVDAQPESARVKTARVENKIFFMETAYP
jgi:hypothetical protein